MSEIEKEFEKFMGIHPSQIGDGKKICQFAEHYAKELEKELEMFKDICLEFNERVHLGQVRSQHTFNRIVKALEGQPTQRKK
jgi:hypothetical protein